MVCNRYICTLGIYAQSCVYFMHICICRIYIYISLCTYTLTHTFINKIGKKSVPERTCSHWSSCSCANFWCTCSCGCRRARVRGRSSTTALENIRFGIGSTITQKRTQHACTRALARMRTHTRSRTNFVLLTWACWPSNASLNICLRSCRDHDARAVSAHTLAQDTRVPQGICIRYPVLFSA